MDYKAKLRHILPTFFVIAFTLIIGLLVFRLFFAIKYEIIDIKEEFWEAWLPMGLPWIPILIWLRPRFRVLIFKNDYSKGRFFFQLISALTITACMMVSQSYLTTATGKLEKLKNVNEISVKEKVRYYKIANFKVNPNYRTSYTYAEIRGKHNESLNFNIYFILPIFTDTVEKVPYNQKYWYGIKFQKQISNRISEKEKESKYYAFLEECVNRVKNYNYHSLDYFERTPKSSNKEYYLRALLSVTNFEPDDSYIILEPKLKPFDQRNGNKLAWTFGSFGIGLSILLFILIFPGYNKTERENLLAGKKPEQDDLIDFLSYLIPKGDHFVTSIIVDINLLVFLLMILSGVSFLSPERYELINWGASNRFMTTHGEWWRLLTSMFVHGGIMHLALNLYGFALAAIFVEPLLGRKKYLLIYIFSGLCGSLASLLWHYSGVISTGASGGIFGLYGAMLTLLLTNIIPKHKKKLIFALVSIYIGLNLLLGMTGGIDNAVHIGGLLGGAMAGMALYKSEIENELF
jgi:rhomboid protease GluP